MWNQSEKMEEKQDQTELQKLPRDNTSRRTEQSQTIEAHENKDGIIILSFGKGANIKNFGKGNFNRVEKDGS